MRDGGQQVRRLAEGRARHRPQHGALRRARVGRAGVRGDAPHQGAVRSARPAEPRRDPQRRPAGAPEGPEAAARRRCRWSTSASSAASASRTARRATSRCRRASASSAGARSRGSKPTGAMPERCARAEDALRLPGHRHLRRLRLVRDGLPGGHRHRAADQGAARPPRQPAGQARRRCGGARHYGASPRACGSGSAPPTCCTASSAPATMKGALDGLRTRLGRTLAEVVAGAAAPGALRAARRAAARAPSASSTSRAARRAPWARSAATRRRDAARVAERLFRRAGFDVVYPAGLDGQCCGQPFESKGLVDAADLQVGRARSRAARRERGRPLADRVRHQPLRLPDEDGSSPAARDPGQHRVRPRHGAAARGDRAAAQAVALHPVCSVRKMGTVDKLLAIAGRCSDARWSRCDEVQCCGFAGDRGFVRPELNEHALRHLKDVAARRLQRAAIRAAAPARSACRNRPAFPYQSILYLVERCSTASDGRGRCCSARAGDGRRAHAPRRRARRCRATESRRPAERAEAVRHHHRAVGTGGRDHAAAPRGPARRGRC